MWKSTIPALKPMILSLSIATSGLSLAHAASDVPSTKKAVGPYLLVANQGDRSLSVIDPAMEKQIAAIPVGGITGHEVTTTPDGRIAFVPIYGNSGVAKAGTDGTSMAVIDLASQKVISTVDFGHAVRPHCPIYDPVSKLLYVTTELDKNITIIDPKTLKIVGTIPTGEEYSHMLTISHNGKRGYTANVEPGSVSVLDMKARKTLTVIPISGVTQRIAISKDDSMVFTSDQTKPQLAVIDTATNKVKTWVPLEAAGYGTGATLDGRWLLVTMPKASKVAVIDLKTLQVARTIDVPKAPQEVLMNPDGKIAYISCNVKNQIAVIDLSDWTVKTLIDAGKTADGLAWAK